MILLSYSAYQYILGHSNYILNLTASNELGTAQWLLEYSTQVDSHILYSRVLSVHV